MSFLDPSWVCQNMAPLPSIIYAEFGRYPLQDFWWKQVLLYRSRLHEICHEKGCSAAHLRLMSTSHITAGQLMLITGYMRALQAMPASLAVCLMQHTPIKLTTSQLILEMQDRA